MDGGVVPVGEREPRRPFPAERVGCVEKSRVEA